LTITDTPRHIIPRDTSQFMADPVPPGDVLLHDFMKPAGITQSALARAIGVPPIRVSEIVRGMRAITADSAMRLSRFFGTTPELWLNLQSQWELATMLSTSTVDYLHIVPLRERESLVAHESTDEALT
jgi:antitoxin HigA-1